MTSQTQTLTVERPSTDADAPLHPVYHRYPRQTDAQYAYLELDCRAATLRADWSGEIGNAVPMDVYHGHRRRYFISAQMTARRIGDLLDAIEPLAQAVVDGYNSQWDGSNHVAVLTVAAGDIEDSIQALCDEAAQDLQDAAEGGVWCAGDWLQYDVARDAYGLRAEMTDEEMVTVREELETQARADGISLDGLDELLEDYRQRLQDENNA